MFGWFIRILLLISGSIASWFVARNSLNFQIVQMVIAVLLFTFAILLIAFWANLCAFFKRSLKNQKNSNRP